MTSRNLVPANKLFTGSSYRFLTYSSNVAYPNPLSNIYNASGVEVMNISHSNVRIYGNVGIGTTSPQAALYVHGDISIFRESKIQFAVGSQLRAYIKSNPTNNALEFGSEGLETMRIMTSTNFVGIGTTIPIQRLHVQGQIYASDNITAMSDERYKTNIQKITNVVEKIKQISGYTYTKIEDVSNKSYMGVIAQEVDKVFPEVIEKNGETLSVAYGNMVAPLIEVIKELIHRVEVLEARPY